MSVLILESTTVLWFLLFVFFFSLGVYNDLFKLQKPWSPALNCLLPVLNP